MSLEKLESSYAVFQKKATELAGSVLDIPRRVGLLTSVTRETGGNHVFPLLAAHGALWALGYFEAGGSLGRLIAKRYFYNSTERVYRLGILRDFSERFRKVNRKVCIDTYANYLFTRDHGEDADAERIIPPNLLDALNRVHHASRTGKLLTEAEKRDVFEQSFLCEQEVTVSPGVQEAIDGFDCRIMRQLCLKPIVRFAYFPRFRYLFFWNFGNTEERIDKGMASFRFAEKSGWDHVQKTLMYYGHLPGVFAEDHDAFMAEVFES